MSKCAIVTICKDEPHFMKMWYEYYSQHFADADIYILDNGCQETQWDGIGGNIELTDHPLTIENAARGHSDTYITQPKIKKCLKLLESYEYVMNVDTDEFVVPDPDKYPGGLKQFIDGFTGVFAQCTGYNVLDNGVPFNPVSKPWLAQRDEYHCDWNHYCKVVLASENPEWGGGSHNSKWNHHDKRLKQEHMRPDLNLFHLHYMCKELLTERYNMRGNPAFNPENAARSVDAYYNHPKFTREMIPGKWKQAL